VISIISIGIVLVLSSVLGALSLRYSRTTSDFLVASRSVSPRLNAAAICGEYLSAGTFLGLAGLVMVFGIDMVWYPIGFTAGYVALLVFVAAPLRRFGSYTIPEFAEGRLESTPLRRLCAVFVLIIGFLYLLPQMKGAGITLSALTGAPYWVGVVLVAVVVGGNVAFGGMRGVTFVQAVQYFIKVFALAVSAIVLWAATIRRDPPPAFVDATPMVAARTALRIQTPSVLRLERPTMVTIDGVMDGRIVAGQITLQPGVHGLEVGTKITLPAYTPVPFSVSASGRQLIEGRRWYVPFQSSVQRQHPVYLGISLIFATVLGTMGLPHILVRFYTNPDGRAARRTIVVVIAMLGLYYIWPIVLGVIGRRWAADLLVSGNTDAVVVLLPKRILSGLPAELLTGLLAAGAFAAFLSTSSGLLVSVAGAVSHDLSNSGVRRFRQASIGASVVAAGLGLGAERFEINVLVGWAFAIAASSFCPLLILGVWWKRFTAVGAACGLLVGGGMALAAVLFTMFGPRLSGWPQALLAQPAAWSVPSAFVAAIVGSLLTADRLPVAVGSHLTRMHTPE
jgi:Na+(H+)/acetate symporter ActP